MSSLDPSIEPTFAPTRTPTVSSLSGSYYGASAGIIITTCLFGMTIFLSVLVCIRRFLLLRQLDHVIQLRYDLEAELADAPEVTATPYVDVDVELCAGNMEQPPHQIIPTDEINSVTSFQINTTDVIPPADTIVYPSPSSAHDKNGRPIPIYAEHCEPFIDTINR